jgi:hypothetical protein
MSIKSKTAIFSALLVAFSGVSLPASAAAVSPAELSWSNSTSAPASAADFETTTQIGVLATRYPFAKFTSALAVGDTFAFAVSLSRPAGSQVTLLDSNGSVAGGSAMFVGLSSSNWGTPAYDNSTGLITGAVTTSYSSTAFARLGSFSIIPDVAGDFQVTITAMSNSGSGWTSTAASKSAVFHVYDLLTSAATLLQTAGFGTGVELDADGNIYWLDSGSKIFKTTTSGVTTQFSLAPTSATKLFVEGPWLYVQASDQVYRISMSNTNQAATPKIVQGKSGMLTQAFYAQAQGYSRIAGQNYVSMNIPHAGEIWRYPTESQVVDVSTYSVTSSVATLTVPAGHGFQVGDSINIYFGGIPYISDLVRTVTAVTATEVKFAYATSNVASTATPNGQVAKSVGAATLLTTVAGAVRGMVPSPDGRYLYIAYATGKKILRLDLQNLAQAPVTFADLSPINYAPDDITILDDGTFVVAAYSASGALWHIGADGKILNKIAMTLGGVAVSYGYDLRMSQDGSTVYLAAQNRGFLALPLSRSLSGSTRGTSNLLQPTSGPIPATIAAASIYDSGASNISMTSALLRGTVNPNGTATQTQLRWSTDPNFPAGSTSTSPIESLVGSTVQAIEYQATGLVANTTYYFQVMAGNLSTNEVFGGVRSFNTAALPGITSLSVSTGPAAGGTSVQLSIQGFSSTPTVKVGGVLATNVVFTAPGTLTFDTPPQAGTGIFIEYGVIVAYAAFTYASPLITAISPVSGVEAGGFAVTVSGSNFTGTTGFTVDGIATTFSFVSDGSLTFTAPANSSGSKTVQITTPSGTAAIQLTYDAALPTPGPTQSAPSAPSTPSSPAPEAPTVRAPRAVISVTLSKGVVDRKSRIVLTLPEATQDSPINSVRVHLKNAKGEITQTLVIPLKETTDTLDFEVPLAYGDYDVSVSTFNAAGYSSELVNVGGIIAKDTISVISSTKWPTIKGVKMLQRLLFEPNSARLTAAAKKSLLAIRENLKGFNGRVLVSGFAAKFGPSSRGKQISTARALAVAKELKALGLNSWIEYHGHGQLPSSSRGMRRVDVSLIENSVREK